MDEMFVKNYEIETRSFNFENSTIERGQGGKSNHASKGHPSEVLFAGEEKVIFDVTGSGIINHIWLTYNCIDGMINAVARRGIKVECYWDGAKTPAVSMPIGEFFGLGTGDNYHFENELFGCMGGKALNSYLKMPFLKSAKIVVVNELDYNIPGFFYTIDYCFDKNLAKKNPLYLHGTWHRESPTEFKRDFEILPKVEGNGRFVGCIVTVVPNPDLKGTWWGEGEVKMFIDGDKDFPTICGTGAEDYPGTGWGMGQYIGRYQGCLSADENQGYVFYRFHIPDPVDFTSDIRVTIQQIGGAVKEVLLKAAESGAKIEVVSAEDNSIPKFLRIYDIAEETGRMITLYDDDIKMHDWCNFYRQDDVAAAAFFYLDNNEAVLPPLADVSIRLKGVQLANKVQRDDA